MDELQKRTPPTAVEKEDAVRSMSGAQSDKRSIDETVLRRYLASRETWLDDTLDPICLNPHLVTEPGGLSELSVDLDDKESRKHYLARVYMNAVLDGYLTPEQASAAGDAGKALLKELGLTEDAAPKHSALPEKTEECYAPWMLAMPEKLRDPETLRQAQE